MGIEAAGGGVFPQAEGQHGALGKRAASLNPFLEPLEGVGSGKSCKRMVQMTGSIHWVMFSGNACC